MAEFGSVLYIIGVVLTILREHLKELPVIIACPIGMYFKLFLTTRNGLFQSLAFVSIGMQIAEAEQFDKLRVSIQNAIVFVLVCAVKVFCSLFGGSDISKLLDVVNVRDAERFAKLVKSNSVMGFAKFISLALDDWPESDVFQKIAITPPDEELNDSEYYLGLMSRISAIKDIAAVEDVLLEREPIFQRYELELWRRIAIVLTDRGDIRRLYNSGLKYIRFLKEISEKVTIRDEAVDAIEAYCVGLHNAEAVDEYGAFLKKCGELTQLLADNKRIAVICCQNYGRLMHLRLYKNVNAEIQEEWNAIVEILKQCNYDEDVYKNVLDAVEEYFRTLVQRKKEDKLFELERFMAQVYEENGRCEAAEVAALCLANLYNSGGHRKITPDEYETIKKYLQKFPESMHIRAAFIIASEAIYSPSAEYKRVPDKIINKAKQWSEQYPKKIEFQEAYFGLLFSRLKYAQAQDMRNEQRRVYREMKTVAERANYSEYNESNQLMESVDILHRVFGY